MPRNLNVELADLSALATQRPLTPEELGQLLSVQDEAEQQRLALAKLVRELEKIDNGAESLLLDQIRKHKVLNIQSGGITACIVGPKYKPHVQQWDKFYDYIRTQDDFSLLERRPSLKAVTERWDDNMVIPGVEKYPVYSLSKTRV